MSTYERMQYLEHLQWVPQDFLTGYYFMRRCFAAFHDSHNECQGFGFPSPQMNVNIVKCGDESRM